MTDYSINDYLKNVLTEELGDASVGGAPENNNDNDNTQVEPASKEYPEEPVVNIDKALTCNDMLTLLLAEINRKGIAGDHITSMNTFYKTGLKQIITKLFKAEFNNMKNMRDKTEEDREIDYISASVEFLDIELKPPTTIKYSSRHPEMLTPNMARLKNLAYMAPLYATAKITATAILKSGKTKTREEFITKDQKWRIASVPVMTGTELDNLWRAPVDTLKALEEDPKNPGGVFIIKGTEWAVDKSENLVINMMHGYLNRYGKEVARATFQSKPGDAYENSYYIVVKYLTDGQIIVQIVTNKFEQLEIPYYLIFRAFGMTRDYDIIDNIVYGVDGTDLVTKYMLDILDKAFRAPNKDFDAVLTKRDSDEILMFIASKMLDMASNPKLHKDANAVKYVHNRTYTLLDKYIFPHIGNGKESRISKLRFLGHVIHKLIRIEMGVLDSTDRDSYRNKRVHPAGVALGKTAKTQFNFAGPQEIKKHLIQAFKNSPFSRVQMAEEVTSSVDANAFERSIIQSIITGEKKLTIKRNEVTNRVSSQQLYHKNDTNVKATLNNITTHGQSAAKATDRAQDMRMAHNTYYGYIGMAQSADTGDKVGMNKQMAITASVSEASSSYFLKDYLMRDPDIIPLVKVPPADINKKKLTKVFVNGDWIGLCSDSTAITKKYRTARRYGDINPFTTIAQEYRVRELYFWVDVGRLLRPLIIVYNNITEFNKQRRAGKKDFKFKQWIKLTKDHIRGLQSGAINMDDLRKQRVLEYIAPEEAENIYTALSLDVLLRDVNDYTKQYTHCDIEQAMFGVVELSAPNTNHTPASRITMFTNQKKQTCGWFALNWPFRIDKNTFLQYYCEMPTVRAFSNAITYPTAQNVMLAYMTSKGYGQEDSMEMSQSSIDLGLFNGSHFYYAQTELEKGESFGNPDYARTLDIKKDAVYEYIDESGFIKEGTEIHKGYVLIVKRAKLKDPTNEYLYTDRSIIYKLDEPAFVEQVIHPRNDEDVLVAKVKLRSYRPLRVGDKLCLTPDHEVLTTNGWKNITNVTTKDLVATLNHEGGHFEYEKPTRTYSYDINENVYEVDSDHVSLKTTLNHKMYVKCEGNYRDKFQLIPASEVAWRQVHYKKNAKNTNSYIDTIAIGRCKYISIFQTDDWLEFLGIYIYSGHIGDNCVVITASHQDQVERLLQVCERMNIRVIENGDICTIYSESIYSELQTCVGDSLKKIPQYVFDVNTEQARILLNNLHSDTIHANNIQLRDDVMRLALHCEYAADYETVKTVKAVKTITSNNTHYIVNIVKTHCEPLVIKTNGTQNVHYDGKVYCIEVPNHIFYVRRNGKSVWTGNSSHAGCKGITAMKTNRADLPYTEDGVTPDAIINPHSVPTRMVIGQIIETMMAQLAVLKGCLVDGTPFKKIDIDKIIETLEKKYGIKYGGHKRMFNGKTGNWYDSLIFFGPTAYQRLQKFVADENYAMSTGPTCALTRQPLDGKTNNGGLRIGEMEKDIFCSHGIMRVLFSKFYRDSDGIDLFVCRLCGDRATVNQRGGMYNCKKCKDNADIVNVPSSWVANLFFNEVNAMGVNVSFEVEPFGYSRYQT